jgi:hypothetical protein
MINRETIVELANIIGRQNVFYDPSDLSKYYKNDIKSEQVLITPESEAQIQDVINFLNPRDIKIYTPAGEYCPPENAMTDSVILDTKKMNKVHEVDSLNLLATIGPGVTFPQLIQEVKRIDDTLKIALPVAADSPYVLANYMRLNTNTISPTLRGRTIMISNYHVVLPEKGEIFKSGSHSISEQDHLPDWPGTGGTAASIAFYGTDDALGIPFKAVIWIFPIQKSRKKLAIGFDDVEKVKLFLKEQCRSGRMIEAYAANNPFMAVLLNKDGFDIEKSRNKLPQWTVVGSIEGSEELTEVTGEILLNAAKDLGGAEIRDQITGPIVATLERPWYVWDRNCYKGASRIAKYNSLVRRAGEFDKIFFESVGSKKYPNEDIGHLIVPLKQGRSLYCEYDIYFSPQEEKLYDEIFNKAYLDIVKTGAFVDRPKGDIAKYIYSKNPDMFNIQKRIKKNLDPSGILNPDQLIAQEA